jgi:hypothetical protein
VTGVVKWNIEKSNGKKPALVLLSEAKRRRLISLFDVEKAKHLRGRHRREVRSGKVSERLKKFVSVEDQEAGSLRRRKSKFATRNRPRLLRHDQEEGEKKRSTSIFASAEIVAAAENERSSKKIFAFANAASHRLVNVL